jgi:hypothetical protein
MDVSPHLYTADVNHNPTYNYYYTGPDTLDNQDYFIGHKNIQRHKESVIKAMMVALLTNNGKRSTTLSSDTLEEKQEIFFNCLRSSSIRDTTIKPWDTWRDTHTTLNTLSTASKTNGVVTITTSSSHGLDTQYDDWGAVITTGDTNFDISAAEYPNGIPIKIIDTTTFTYRKSGSDVSSTSVTGSADIKIGWGGSSNNLHLYFT